MDKIKLEIDLVQVLIGSPGCNITYILDVSERAGAVLGSVKRLLIQTLLAKASLGDSLFNMVRFSNTVDCWSWHMLPCLPNTVFTALPWVHSISCSPGRHLLAALTAALSDPACNAVHLLCTDLPEQLGLLLRFLSALATCRPVNVFYLQGPSRGLEISARDYLLCLSQATRGSCHLIMFDLEGTLQKVIPLHIIESQPSAPSSQTKCSHSASTIKSQPTSPALRCRPSVGEFSSGLCVLCGPEVAGSKVFPGHRVLARRQADDLFYPGTVIQQVQGCKGLWVVEFEHGGSAGFDTASSQRVLVCSLDLVVDSRGHNHRLVPGDFVLSPWESDLRRYGLGRVVAVASHSADVMANLQVLMWDSSVSLVPDSLVLPVSLYHYFRLVRQLQIPAPAFGRCCSQVCSKSPYPLRRSYTHCCQSTHTQPCVVPPSCRPGLGEPCHFNRDEFVRNGHSETPTSPTIEENASISPEAKLWSKQRRPPWRYWRRTGPEPQHKQPGSEVNRMMLNTAASLSHRSAAHQTTAPCFSLFLVPTKKNMNIRDIFRTASFRPQPPAQRQSFSAGKATLIPTY